LVVVVRVVVALPALHQVLDQIQYFLLLLLLAVVAVAPETSHQRLV
jgi:hypothetical protein